MPEPNPATSFELKIMSLERLRYLSLDRYAQWGKVVLAHGCFDLLHPGHLTHLKQAREMGDTLVVSVTADKHIHKGPGRPVHNERERAAMVAALDFVHAVTIVDDPTALPVILGLKPKVYAKGAEYENCQEIAWLEECKAVQAHGGEVRFTNGETASSSKLINSYLSPLSPDVQRFLTDYKAKYTLADTLGWLDKVREVKATVIGEPILDEYVFVRPRGKSPKDSIVCFEETGRAWYDGGSSVVATHLAQICQVEHPTAGGKRIIKTRYVLEPFQIKQFMCCDGSEVSGTLPEPHTLRGLTVVADFGHGLISPAYASAMAAADFVALTCQTNSLNFGFNLLTKWPKASYVVCDEEELRLSCGDAVGEVGGLAMRELQRLGANALAVTMGHKGCLVVAEGQSVTCPALADKVIDRTGAGDAFLGYTSPLAYLGAPIEVIALVGSIASAIKVGILGNKAVERDTVVRWISAMLK